MSTVSSSDDCRTCPQCKSRRTIAINERLRRCRDCRYIYEPRSRQTVGSGIKRETKRMPNNDNWQSIDTAPREELILIANIKWAEPVRAEKLKPGPLKWVPGFAPTHWQPLPAPPINQQGRDRVNE